MKDRARAQFFPEFGPVVALADEPVNIPQVAQAPGEIAIGKKMRDRMDDHVFAAQDAKPIGEWLAVGDQGIGIGSYP